MIHILFFDFKTVVIVLNFMLLLLMLILVTPKLKKKIAIFS